MEDSNGVQPFGIKNQGVSSRPEAEDPLLAAAARTSWEQLALPRGTGSIQL